MQTGKRASRQRPQRKRQAQQLEQDRVEKMTILGSRLRQVRLQQAISLEQVAAQTKIQQRLLNALEEGRMSDLPEPVYVQGFIKRFAEVLGLDEPEFTDVFSGNAPLRSVKQSWRSLPAAQLRPMHLYAVYICLIVGAVNGLSYLMNRSNAEIVSQNVPAQPALKQPNGQPNGVKTPKFFIGSPNPASVAGVTPQKPIVASVASSVVVFQPAPAPQQVQPLQPVPAKPISVAVVPAVRTTARQPQRPTAVPQLPKPQPVVASTGRFTPLSPALANLVPPIADNFLTAFNPGNSAQSLHVSVTLKEVSWLRVTADGKTEFEGLLPEGTQREWGAKTQLTLLAGNAGGVLVSLNNGQTKQLGTPGSVKEVTFEAGSQAAQNTFPRKQDVASNFGLLDFTPASLHTQLTLNIVN